MVPINGSEEGKRGGQWMELTRADDETWAVKAETALPAAATVVAIAEEAQGRAASKRAADRRGGEETGRREPGADGV
jgi:hypothetical protein